MRSFVSFLSLPFIVLLTGCGATTLDKYSATSIGIQREYQRVIRFDCDNQVISDKIETVRAPTEWVEIPPTRPSRVWSSSFYNTTTRSSAGMIAGNSKFQIDYSWGALNMHVQSGSNTIDYKFYECEEIAPPIPNQSPTCKTTPRLIEEGNLTINVSYNERTLGGHQEVVVCEKPRPKIN